jgi:hypothetical protein
MRGNKVSLHRLEIRSVMEKCSRYGLEIHFVENRENPDKFSLHRLEICSVREKRLIDNLLYTDHCRART